MHKLVLTSIGLVGYDSTSSKFYFPGDVWPRVPRTVSVNGRFVRERLAAALHGPRPGTRAFVIGLRRCVSGRRGWGG